MTLTVLIIDLEVNPDSNTIFKIGAFRPDSGQSFDSQNIKNDTQRQKAFIEIEKLTIQKFFGTRLAVEDSPSPSH